MTPIWSRFGRLFGTLIILALIPFMAVSQITVRDMGLVSGLQDTIFGHHKKGRAGIAADFNLDGYIDYYIGNPGEESFILLNVPGPGTSRRFVFHQILLEGDLAWGAVAFDYDNDRDYDLFITCGANEGVGYDYLFRNDLITKASEGTSLWFTDVTATAGVSGPVPFGETIPIATASANARIADYDRDGDEDIFVSGNIHGAANQNYPELIGRNTLWRNNGDGTFDDVTEASGLSRSLEATRHSTWIDYNDDGYPDLYESNMYAANILWRNNGDGTFTDVTEEMSAPGHALGEPTLTFVSGTADFNNDGWEDIVAFMRGHNNGQRVPGEFECSVSGINSAEMKGYQNPIPTEEVYPNGHAIFLNNRGTSFSNYAFETIINDDYTADQGVMGSMVGDINNDGIPDIYVGNGGPNNGTRDQLYVSIPGTFASPVYEDLTSLIDYPAEVPPGFPVPTYPYRTHGTCFVDIDNDGILEISVVNGGPAGSNDIVREPNRLFMLSHATPTNWFKIRPVGNAHTVAADAIGTKISVTVSKDGGTPWTVYQTLHAGNCFSAQNGFTLHFGLYNADRIEEVVIRWPDGTVATIRDGLNINSSIVAYQDRNSGVVLSNPGSRENSLTTPGDFSLEQNYPNPFNPSTTIRFAVPSSGFVTLEVFDVLGKRIASLVSEELPAGGYSVSWDATKQPSGLYLYRLQAAGLAETRKLMLLK